MRQETCNSNWFAIRGQKGIRLENEIFIAAAASSSGFFHMDHLWISIFFVHLDRYLRCSSSSSASNDQSIEQIQWNISSIATLSFLSSTYPLNIMFKFHNRNQSSKTVTLNGFCSQQLQHRNKIYLSTLRWNCINAKFFLLERQVLPATDYATKKLQQELRGGSIGRVRKWRNVLNSEFTVDLITRTASRNGRPL